MQHKTIILLCLLFANLNIFSQEISSSNTDEILQRAIELYRNKDYTRSLAFTNRGLELAPEYHDIRLFRIRNNFALNNLNEVDTDLKYLLNQAPNYIGVKVLVYKRINEMKAAEQISNIQNYKTYYPEELHFEVLLASAYLDTQQKEAARNLAQENFGKENLSDGDRYLLQQILNRTNKDVVAVNYQIVNFLGDYPRKNSWHNYSVEYQHNFNKTAVIGRANYSDRYYDDGILYELEAYPVFSSRMYAFINLGYSNSNIFPELSTSASVFYNFAKKFEAEAGTRILHYNESSYFTGILGLTLYQDKFYINARTFLGPKRQEQLVQNYQLNLRYYLNNADSYLLLTFGSGISPDERNIYTLVQDNPSLQAYYTNLGLRKTLGFHHIVQLTSGYLHEDIGSNRTGSQIIGNINYRYRF